jgi:hypothetical protein
VARNVGGGAASSLSLVAHMSLIHAVVADAKSSTILIESSNGQRDFSTAVKTILSKIPPNNSKLTCESRPSWLPPS